jgi:MoaA/NifB/PqqE/SkfB family radical SAM enzyme
MKFPEWGTKVLAHKAVRIVVGAGAVAGVLATPFAGYWSWLVYAVSLGVILLTIWAVARAKPVQFLANINEGPDNLGISAVLDSLGKHRGQLHVLGRTCLQWLCADESMWEVQNEAYDGARLAQQERVEMAVRDGGSIHFILQGPGLAYPFDAKGQEESRDRLARQHGDAVKSYHEIAARLPAEARGRLQLSYSLQGVDNSMTRLTLGGEVTRFVLDLGTQFKRPEGTNWKPVLVFAQGATEMSEYNAELERIVRAARDEMAYEEERSALLERLAAIESRHPHMSRQRRDGSAVLERFAAALHQKHSVPPVSVQILVTNHCSTRCAMCRHWEIPQEDEKEMALWELENVFKMIEMMGTRAIIVSGGEPLMRDDLEELLARAQEHKLRVGLLTNGVSAGLEPLEPAAAKRIASMCDWIQVSLDAFEGGTYQAVRGVDAFEAAATTLRGLSEVAPEKIEACYTIQAGNIAEFEELRKAKVLDVLPSGVGLRFKFAHGPDSKPSFLIHDPNRVDRALSTLRDGDWGGVNNNIDYLTEMVGSGYFSCAGLASGTPVGAWVEEKKALGHRCHILSLTCKIDAVGDVYPCCFLFDDNNSGDSQLRRQFLVGSLRRNQMVPEPTAADNLLSSLWYNSSALSYWRGKALPVHAEACTYCTRHAYQNEYLNEFVTLFGEGSSYGIAEAVLARQHEADPGVVWV